MIVKREEQIVLRLPKEVLDKIKNKKKTTHLSGNSIITMCIDMELNSNFDGFEYGEIKKEYSNTPENFDVFFSTEKEVNLRVSKEIKTILSRKKKETKLSENTIIILCILLQIKYIEDEYRNRISKYKNHDRTITHTTEHDIPVSNLQGR